MQDDPMENAVVLEGFGLRLEPLGEQHAEALGALVDDSSGRACPHRRRGDVGHGRLRPRRGGGAGASRVGRRRAVVHWRPARRRHVRPRQHLLYEWSPSQRRVELGSTSTTAPGGRADEPGVQVPAAAARVRGARRRAGRTAGRRPQRAVDRGHPAARCRPRGVLRSHRVAPDGSRGDTAYFSILADEWPSVRDLLLDRIARLEVLDRLA
ncbi:hypothetical protein NKG05_08910 [Oerskovia sp. M15]